MSCISVKKGKLDKRIVFPGKVLFMGMLLKPSGGRLKKAYRVKDISGSTNKERCIDPAHTWIYFKCPMTFLTYTNIVLIEMPDQFHRLHCLYRTFLICAAQKEVDQFQTFLPYTACHEPG
jgi:hypothetical protein